MKKDEREQLQTYTERGRRRGGCPEEVDQQRRRSPCAKSSKRKTRYSRR
jgi:hypothetical protein